jgi:hypothetical protein
VSRVILSSTVLLLVSTSNVLGAGIRTHAEMAKRMLEEHFDRVGEMLPGLNVLLAGRDARRALFCGSTGPDWGHQRRLNPVACEYDHWQPFLEQYLCVLQETCPRPWDDVGKRRVAFFLGLVVHDMSDIPWHFNDGAHRAMEPKARRVERAEADLAAEIFVNSECRIAPDLPPFWWPRDDMLAAYAKKSPSAVTPRQLDLGFKSLQSEWVIGALGSGVIYADFKARYPWLAAHYQDYYYGGVEHCAALASMWVKYYYARLNGWHYYQNMPAYSRHPPDYCPYTGCSDATISHRSPNHNAGAEPILEVGRRSDDVRRTLVRFNVSDIPPRTPIRAARLWLFFAGRRGPQSADQTLAVYNVDRPWSQGRGHTDEVDGADGRTAEGGEVTWQATGRDQKEWHAAGCHAAGVDRDEAPISSTVVAANDPAGHWKDWDVTALVQSWIDAPATNHGLLIAQTKNEQQGTGILRFYSSEAFKSRADGYGGGKRVAGRPTLVVIPQSPQR